MNITKHRSARIGIGAGAAGAVMSAIAVVGAFSGSAGAADSSSTSSATRPSSFELSDEQRACLEAQGLTARPQGRPTVEQRKQFKAAAEACGLERPENTYGKHNWRNGKGNRPQLSSEQRECLADQGLTAKPQGRPTAEQREQFKAAAETCGIELPTHPGRSGGRGR